ncbi:zinc finger CCCH domain-containing protein 55-like [Hibiscus syriacus]|uniref:zinc finger CCCH domain-containing protein 55-like n=1 Tax=Hibiscus syriacus TaxID=106335 RepID=UPI001920D2E3|nr:zinc finger CCCH domain-containing protein 55-like [Hibiscus syriacus]
MLVEEAELTIYLNPNADLRRRIAIPRHIFETPSELRILGTLARCEDSISAQANVWFCNIFHPVTVKHILARGNPHYICDSRVLVKIDKEKGKVPDKRQYLQQKLEKVNFSSCSSPSGLDSREPYDPHVGAKMFYNAPEMMLRRELEEQADLQHSIELQRRRLVNLQLPDFKKDGIHHHHCGLLVGASVSLPAHSHDSQNVPPSDSIKTEVSKGF